MRSESSVPHGCGPHAPLSTSLCAPACRACREFTDISKSALQSPHVRLTAALGVDRGEEVGRDSVFVIARKPAAALWRPLPSIKRTAVLGACIVRPSRLLVVSVTRVELLCGVQVSEGLDDFDAARADLLALVGLGGLDGLPDGPVVAPQLPVEVQPSWARLAARERELADVCRRCDVFWLGGREQRF